MFGLEHTEDTPVGDAYVRGVSGGEKKRVSIAEVLANRASIEAWDNACVFAPPSPPAFALWRQG